MKLSVSGFAVLYVILLLTALASSSLVYAVSATVSSQEMGEIAAIVVLFVNVVSIEMHLKLNQ